MSYSTIKPLKRRLRTVRAAALLTLSVVLAACGGGGGGGVGPTATAVIPDSWVTNGEVFATAVPRFV